MPKSEFQQDMNCTVGPYAEPHLILYKYCGPFANTLRFMTPAQYAALPKADQEDKDLAIHQIARDCVATVKLKHASDGSCVLEVIQSPKPAPEDLVTLPDPPDPPIGKCTGPCQPYSKDCPPGAVPSCDTGTLTCDFLAEGKDGTGAP